MTTLKFKNVERLSGKEYMTFLTGSELLKEWKANNIEYIPEIQRGSKTIKDKEGNNVLLPIYSAANVKKMKKHIKDKTFYVSQITLNVFEDGELLYDESDKSLEVENATIAILDGQHRLRALEEIDNENNEEGNEDIINLDQLIFPVKISNYNEEKAQEQFYQFTLGSKISSSRIEYFNNKDVANKIVKKLFLDSILSNKIEIVRNNISRKDEQNIISYATLKNAVQLSFNTDRIETIDEIDTTVTYLKEFFEELFNVMPEFNSYEDRVALKEEQSFKCENFAFYGYLVIAEFLQHKDNWKELLPYLNEINYDKTSNPWVSRIIKKNTTKKKDKETKKDYKETTYSIINNKQTRKEIGNLMLKAFKSILRNKENKNDETDETVEDQVVNN